MKKAILSLFCSGLLIAGGAFHAQAQVDKSFYKTPYKSRNSGSFDRSSNIISIGYGFPNHSGTGWAGWGRSRASVGPGYFKYEHGVIDEIGIGMYVAAAGSRVKYGSRDQYIDRQTAIGAGVLGYYHFNKLIPVRGLDVYAGIGVGFTNRSYTFDGGAPGRRGDYTDFAVLPVAKAGVRYYFTRGFGVFGEAGYDDMSSVNMGLSFRF
jgi:hypothetical protein